METCNEKQQLECPGCKTKGIVVKQKFDDKVSDGLISYCDKCGFESNDYKVFLPEGFIPPNDSHYL